MQVRKTRRTERAGVNAAQALFEANNWIFQPVDQGNDYGKDAYVDAAEGDTLTGLCAALQIKSGASYRRVDGFAIPVDDHETIWRNSAIPIMGVVHDPETAKLYWCDISGFLRDNRGSISVIPVPKANSLDASSIAGAFLSCIRRTAEMTRFIPSQLDLVSDVQDLQTTGIFACFRASLNDARPLIMVRRLILSFRDTSLQAAIHMLAHATPHPDIVWGPHNRLPDPIIRKVATSFRWTPEELIHMIDGVEWEDWQRGDLGESLYMLIVEDPDHREKLRIALKMGYESNDAHVVWTALYLSIYLAGSHGLQEYQEILAEFPGIRSLELIGELETNLREAGFTPLF